MFVAEYLKDFDATRAAKAAGYSARTAKEQACQTFRKPAVPSAIARLPGSKRRDRANGNPDERRPHPFANHHSQHVERARSKRGADPDLSRTAADDIREALCCSYWARWCSRSSFSADRRR